MEALSALDAETGGGEKSQSPSGFETPSSSSDGPSDSSMDELPQWSSRKGDHGSKACAGFAWELAWPINWPSQAFLHIP